MERFRRLLVVFVLTVSTAACGAAATPAASAPSTPTANPTPTVSPSATPTRPAVPSGFTVVTDTKNSFSIAVPETWIQLSSSDAAALEQEWKQLASQNPGVASLLSQSYEALKSGAIALVAMDVRGATGGFASNMNVIGQPPQDPSFRDTYAKLAPPQLEAALKLPAGSVHTSQADLPAGPAVILDYSFDLTVPSGKITVQGRQYAVFTAKHLYSITFSSGAATWASYAATFQQIIDSLQVL